MTDVHVIYTDLGRDGWDISSPQVPHLFAGRTTVGAAQADTPAILSFAGLQQGSYTMHTHEQKLVLSLREDEYLIRQAISDVTSDEHAQALREVVGRQIPSVEMGEIEGEIDRIPVCPSGERLLIAVVPSDRLGWIMDQLAPLEGALLSYYGGDNMVYNLPWFNSDQQPGVGTEIEALGLTRDSTVQEAIDKVTYAEVAGLSLHSSVLASK